jgi:predicted secreted protein
MSLVSALAIYFIIWWVVLFAVLPIGVRSQLENDNVTLGTEHGAPARPALARKAAITTAVSLVVFGLFYLVTVVWGFGVDDIPAIVPSF